LKPVPIAKRFRDRRRPRRLCGGWPRLPDRQRRIRAPGVARTSIHPFGHERVFPRSRRQTRACNAL